MDILRDSDPQVFEAIRSEEHRQRDELELIASENYTSAAVMEAVGSVLTNKYAEGLPGRRYYGGCEFVDSAETAGDRPRQGDLRRRARQRPAALRRVGQPGGLLLLPGDRRPRPGDGPRPGGPPDARHEAQLLGPLVPDGRLRRRPQDRADRRATTWPSLAREHRPKLILAGASAYPRTIDVRPDRRDRARGRRDLLRGHGAHRGAGRGGAAPEPRPGGRLRLDDHAQDPARPPRGDRPLQAGEGQEARLGRLPRPPGGPADARDRGQGGLPRRGAAARVQGLRRAGHRQRQDPGRGDDPRRVPSHLRGDRQPPDPDRHDLRRA